MRLIHSNTLELVEFNDSNDIPPYAILSHTWGSDEISFQELSSIVNHREIFDSQKTAAYMKIIRCCEQAGNDGFDYAWIDTCCIDKTNSAELSEAINSMYQWYRKADVCYVYLSDMRSGTDPNALPHSKWFTRGWTLQELIAPTSLIFFDTNWDEIGTKLSLHEDISQITHIPSSLLLGQKDPEEFSIAQRMSWAAERETKKVEDAAYCLMGIFDIYMPMIYGEGHRAFIRLQEEILRTSTDQSIFAWKYSGWDEMIGGGLLASSPFAFIRSGDIIQSNLQTDIGFSLTSHGLSVKVPMVRGYHEGIIDPLEEIGYTFIAILNCERSGDSSCSLGIALGKVTGTNNHFRRVECYSLKEVKKTEVSFDETNISNVFVQQPRNQNRNLYYYQVSELELFGFPENGFWKVGSQLEKANILPLDFGFFGIKALRLTALDGTELVLIIQAKEQVQHIKFIEPVEKSRPLLELNVEYVMESMVTTDRIIWHHPGGRWQISVALRRQISDGERFLMARISCQFN